MLVTAIERTKRGRFSIFLDGEFCCALHVDIFVSSPLQKGVEVTPEQMVEILRQSEEKITRDRAMRLLGQRSYTAKGLYDKLRERAEEDYAAAAVARMAELGLINDADYARRFAADCFNLRGYSQRRTVQELIRKGIDKETAQHTVEEMDQNAEEAIARIVVRKYLRYLGDEKGYNRTVNALARLGYGYGDIRTVITNLLEDEDYYSE